jgi:hypothetical protein
VTTFAGYLFDKRVHRKTVWIVEGGASVAMWDAPSATVTEPVAGVELPIDPVAQVTRRGVPDCDGCGLL